MATKILFLTEGQLLTEIYDSMKLSPEFILYHNSTLIRWARVREHVAYWVYI